MTLPKIEYPISTIEVPSSKQKISVRPMVAREEKVLLIAKESGDPADIAAAIKQIVNNCIVTPKFDIDKLALFDIEFLFLRIRAISVSNIAKVTYTDNEDEKPYNFEIPIDKVQVKFPDKNDNVINVNEKVVLTMKYPSASLYSDSEFLKSEGEMMFAKLIAASIDTVGADGVKTFFEEETKDDQKEFIDSLPLKANEKIRQYLGNMPHLFYQIDYKNEKDHERKIVLTTLTDFFTL